MFADLGVALGAVARAQFAFYLSRWGGRMPGWRRAILAGRARAYALRPAASWSKWGRSMHAKRGGLARQRRRREAANGGKS